jgi:hypothetical protein
MTRRGFTISEGLGAAAAAAVLLALAVVAARQLQTESRLGASVAQLQWLGHTNFSYAGDHGDRFCGFTWKAGDMSSSFPDLREPEDDAQAAAYQAADIVRRRGWGEMPRVWPWMSSPTFSHLPLADYLDVELPELRAISPLDRHRLAWVRNPEAFDRGELLPLQPEPTPENRRVLFSSSYEMSAAFWDQSDIGFRASQTGTAHHSWRVGAGHRFGPVRISEVAFPAQKVWLVDQEQRLGIAAAAHWCEAPGAQVLAAMSDGSSRPVASQASNPGWLPNDPAQPMTTRYIYEPRPYEAPTSTGDPRELVDARYRWTRGGIAGRDIGGPEIDTGQP